MKGILAVLAVMLALVSVGAAFGSYCPPPTTCEWNIIQQSNDASASAKANQDVDQTQTNCAMVMGAGNTVVQSNDASIVANSEFKKVTQSQSNIAMVVGKDNYVLQSNTAVSDCAPQAVLEQLQKNTILVIGESNQAWQTNSASDPWNSGYSGGSSTTTRDPAVKQDQSNIGVLLGKMNSLSQSNTAEATITNGNPSITQTQKNIAFAVNTCKDCVVDTTYAGTTKVSWPVLEISKPTVVEPKCPDCVEDP